MKSAEFMQLLQHRCYAGQGGDKCVDLFGCIVHRKRCAYGAFYTQRLHQRLGAVVAGAHGYSHLVEQHAGVVVVGVAYEK